MNYSRYGWIMMLGYPLDYRRLEFIDQTVSSFGKLITWHNNCRSLGYAYTMEPSQCLGVWFSGRVKVGLGLCQFMC
jgi:hypothetical protein